MDRAFDGEHIDLAPVVDRKRAAPTAFAANGEPPSKRQADRHRQWLRRNLPGGEAAALASYRPLKLSRVAAKRWLSNRDSQLQLHAGVGLELFVPKADCSHWSCWRRWPYCAFALDLGSDGVAAMKWMEYKMKANVDMWPDAAHNCNRDLEAALRGEKLYTFWLCMVMVWNMPYGPFREHQRLHQISEALDELFHRSSYDEVPLFIAKVQGIIACFRRNGHQFDADRPLETPAWELMAARPWAGDRGQRVSLSR